MEFRAFLEKSLTRIANQRERTEFGAICEGGQEVQGQGLIDNPRRSRIQALAFL
jgi:hypothetical protein